MPHPIPSTWRGCTAIFSMSMRADRWCSRTDLYRRFAARARKNYLTDELGNKLTG